MAWATKYRGEFDDLTYGTTPGTSLNVVYGFLYNWYAVDDARNIAASGWHVPTVSELQTLEASLGGGTVVSDKLRETGTTYWTGENGATNSSQFNSRGSGERSGFDGTYYYLKTYMALWTTTTGSGNPYFMYLGYGSNSITYTNENDGGEGCSVRLLKDSTTLSDTETGTYTGNDGKVYRTICIGTQEWLADNLCETRYRNGDLIAEVTDNAAWAALTTGARCSYDNTASNAFTGNTSDVTTNGLLWTIHIEEDDYAGAINEMVMAGQPLVIEHLTPSDDLILGTIKGSKATINAISETHFQYTGLYSVENFKYRVSIYYGESPTLYWRGFLTPEYSEPYDDVPYAVSITASDGLGLLKGLKYDNDGTAYTGRATEALVITRILTKIGFTAFKEYVNVYDTLMASDTDDSPFDQCQVEQDVFIDKDFEAMSCYDVLTEILKKYNAVIRQSNGEMVIYRPLEMTGATVYGRSFTAYDTKTAISITPEQLIDRSGNVSSIFDYNGGVLMMTSPISKFTAEQDYGSRESWIDNHNFDIKTWQGYLAVNDRFSYWTNNYSIAPLGHYGPTSKETQGILFAIGGNAGQTFGANAKQCTDEMFLSFDYLLINFSSSPIATTDVSVMIYDDTYTYWLTNSATEWVAEWTTTGFSSVSVTETSIPVGVGSWATATFRFTGLPINGPYNIIVGWTGTSNIGVAFKGLRFYATSDIVVTSSRKKVKRRWLDFLVGGNYVLGKYLHNLSTQDNYIDIEETVQRVYEATNEINAPESGMQYILGDCENTTITNVIEQFNGSLAVIATGSLPQTATDFVNSFAADYAALSSPGVLLTSSANELYFESDTPGDDFTGATTIVNATGDLAGTVSTATSNSAGTVQIVTITLTGNAGSIIIWYLSDDYPLAYAVSLTATAGAFVTSYAATFAALGITVTSSGADIIFTEATAAGGFEFPYVEQEASNLDGTMVRTQAPAAPVARKDKIVLSGTSGTATVTCHGEANTITFNTGTVLDFTSAWSTRGGSEAKPIIELVADEIAALYARERHFIQMQMRETSVTGPDFNVLYNLQDSINKYNNYIRIFAVNRGTFDVKRREWSADVMEIGVSSVATYSADDDTTTVDSTTITVDSE